MFARIREWLFNLTAVIIAVVVLSSILIASYELESWPFGDHRTFRERYQFRRVERASLEPFLGGPAGSRARSGPWCGASWRTWPGAPARRRWGRAPPRSSR